LAYTVTTTPWGSTPSGITCTLLNVTDSDNPTSAAVSLSGSVSAAGDVITTKTVSGLTLTNNYKLSVLFTDAQSNTWEAYLIIQCR
jgi:hypothetical protein